MPEEKLTESQLPSMPLVSPAPSHKAFPCQIKMLFLFLNPEQTSSNLCSRVLGCKLLNLVCKPQWPQPAGPSPTGTFAASLLSVNKGLTGRSGLWVESLHQKGSWCMLLFCFVFIVSLSSVWFGLQQNERFYFCDPVFLR